MTLGHDGRDAGGANGRPIALLRPAMWAKQREVYIDLASKLQRLLPWDGIGLFTPTNPVWGPLRRRAAKSFWRRCPWWSRLFLVPLCRVAWSITAPPRVRRFARKHALKPHDVRQLLADCLYDGAAPQEAFVWRRAFAPSVRHPMPGRSAGLLLRSLGDKAEQLLLADKLTAERRLAEGGIPVPTLVATVAADRPLDPSADIWAVPGRFFVKPRHGSAGQGAMTVESVLPCLWRIGDSAPVDRHQLRQHLAMAANGDSLLVQERLDAAPDLADLAGAGLPPVLRLNTARCPGGRPLLHSALLAVPVPGERHRNFLRGHVRVPIDTANGNMARGLWFAEAKERLVCLPWNQAPLSGRQLLDFDQTAALALRAMTLFPNLPLISWDIILAPRGPVFLEGNTCGDWILTSLSAAEDLPTPALAPLMHQWAEQAAIRRKR